MIRLSQEMMRGLSFEDFDIEKIEFSRENKELKIFIDGGWMSIKEGLGYDLGRGILYFSDWESIIIKTSDAFLNGLPEGALNNLCEVSFSKYIVYLAGYGPEEWIEWIMIKPKMSAEFEEYHEGDY